MLVGAGTILSARQAQRAAAAGAQFLVSPGSTPALLAAMDDTGLPYLPGTSTVSEMLAVAEHGHTAMKFFPAEAAGGAPYLASLASPLPELRFCPTGGITAASAGSYLRLPNVGCVGRLVAHPGRRGRRGRLGPDRRAGGRGGAGRRLIDDRREWHHTTAVSCLVCRSRRSSFR